MENWDSRIFPSENTYNHFVHDALKKTYIVTALTKRDNKEMHNTNNIIQESS